MNGSRRWLGVLALTSIVAMAGCRTLGEDLADFAESLTPVTGAKAARWALDLNDADRRRKGVILISNSDFGGVDVYLELYRRYVELDTDPVVRSVSIRALARHGAPEDAMLIAQNLTHEIPQVRWEAALGLQRLHNPDAVPAMLAVLRNEAELAGIRAEIARGLGQYPQDRVFQGLVGGLDAWELSVNRASVRSLELLTGVENGVESREWLSWYNRVAAEADPFAGRGEYLYRTYTREETLLEKMAFWSSKDFEQPGLPVGLRPADERRTYQDEDEITDQDG